MNTLRNSVNLIGHLGKDPEFREMSNNTSFVRFSLATSEPVKNKNNEWEYETTWHNVVAWGANAEKCKRLLKKGSKIALKGKIVNDSYTSKEGEKRQKTEVVIREFMPLDAKVEKLEN